MVESFNFLKLSGRVPLKLGHNEEQPLTDGEPALGWVENLYRKGRKLAGDFTDVPKVVYDLIKRGAYKYISVELMGDVQAGTRLIPWVLDAVALLGADIPAVGTLKDLQALVMHKLHGLRGQTSVAFKRESTNFGGRETMADENDEVKALKAALAKAEAKADEATARADALKAEAGEATSYKRRFEELSQQTHAQKVEAHRKVVKDMFEKAVSDKVITAAARERFYKHFDVEADDVLKLSVKDVEEYIKENPNPFARKGPATGSGSDEIVTGGFADQETLAKARKYCRDNNLDPNKWENLEKAAKAVFRSERDLARRYQSLPDDFASGALAV